MERSTINEETALLYQSKLGTEERTPLPKLQLAIVLFLHLCEPFASNSIFPYINQLISELDITNGDKRKVGYYAGLIESLFFATEAVTVLQWGRISDRIGRKPVLLIGLAGNAFSMLCFGLSRTFWGLVLSRCLCGLLNGNIGVAKSVIGEITDSSNRAEGLSLLPAIWSVGATVAPLIGGSLSRPHERFPNVFSGPFWEEYPYFLPCFAIAIFMVMSFLITLIYFKETLMTHQVDCISPRLSAPTVILRPPRLRALLTYRVILSISNYVCLSFMEMSFMSLLPLFMATPIKLGGLGFSPVVIGYSLGALGAYIGIFQMLFFTRLVRRFGERQLFIVGTLTVTISSILFPCISVIVRRTGVTWIIWSLLAFTLSLKAFLDMSFSCIFIYVIASSPSKSSLGATNGIAQTMVSIARAFGPGLATSLFAVSLEKDLLGGYAVYAALFAFSCFSLILATHLPPQVWDETY